MPRARVGEVELEYDVRGAGPPLVLIMGIGAQLIHWPEPFCDQLAAHGLTVIRFDNRDAGRSTCLEHLPPPRLLPNVLRVLLGRRAHAPYSLSDMAADVVGLLDALELEDAHVVGISMGGMIAQVLAIEHPARVRTLTSFASTPGDRRFARPRALASLLEPVPSDRQAAIRRSLKIMKAIGSPDYPMDEAAFLEIAHHAYERGVSSAGFARQFAAILASGNRLRRLADVRAPTLVLHGAEDPLIPLAAGEATAAAIPGAVLEVIPGLGHDLPRPLWPRITARIADHVLRHEQQAAPR